MSGLKAMRKKAGLTQNELACKLGVKQATVAMWETESSFPRAELLPTIASVLNCTIDELYAKQSA